MDVTFAKHVHHDVLIEPLVEPLEVRRGYIRQNKPPEEQDLRLDLLATVISPLPEPVVRAGKEYARAWQGRMQAWEGYERAKGEYLQVLGEHKTELEAIHNRECPDCPWNGETIFPEEAP